MSHCSTSTTFLVNFTLKLYVSLLPFSHKLEKVKLGLQHVAVAWLLAWSGLSVLKIEITLSIQYHIMIYPIYMALQYMHIIFVPIFSLKKAPWSSSELPLHSHSSFKSIIMFSIYAYIMYGIWMGFNYFLTLKIKLSYMLRSFYSFVIVATT